MHGEGLCRNKPQNQKGDRNETPIIPFLHALVVNEIVKIVYSLPLTFFSCQDRWAVGSRSKLLPAHLDIREARMQHTMRLVHSAEPGSE